jgi:hypothetical protein
MSRAEDRHQHQHRERGRRAHHAEPHRRPEQERQRRIEERGREVGVEERQVEHHEARHDQPREEQHRFGTAREGLGTETLQAIGGARHDHRHDRQIGEHVGGEAQPHQLEVLALAPADQRDEAGVQEGGRERRHESAPCEEHAGAAQRIEPQRAGHEDAHQPRADQRLAAVAHVPAQHHGRRHAALQLGEQVRRQDGGEQRPPPVHRRKQQRRHQQRVRRPERRDRMRLEGEGESDARRKVIAERDQQRRNGDGSVDPQRSQRKSCGGQAIFLAEGYGCRLHHGPR